MPRHARRAAFCWAALTLCVGWAAAALGASLPRVVTTRRHTPRPSTRRHAYALYAPHKSGSMWAFRIMGQMCGLRTLHLFSHNTWTCCASQAASCCRDGYVKATTMPLEDKKPVIDASSLISIAAYFRSESDAVLHDTLTIPVTSSTSRDFCVGPLRMSQPLNVGNDVTITPIFILRHPLDILVSQYYSYGWTHPPNAVLTRVRYIIQRHSADEFALAMAPVVKAQLALALTLDPAHVTAYSEMVLAPHSWMRRVARLMRFDDPDTVAELLAVKNKDDMVVPGHVVQDTFGHRRVGVPGDFRASLTPATIHALTRYFDKELRLLRRVEGGIVPELLYGTVEHSAKFGGGKA